MDGTIFSLEHYLVKVLKLICKFKKNWKQYLPQITQKYDIFNIWNFDEIDLFCCGLSQKVYNQRKKKQKNDKSSKITLHDWFAFVRDRKN